MIFWIFVIIFVIGIVMCVIGSSFYSEGLIAGGLITSVASGMVALICLIFIIHSHFAATGTKAACEETYKSLLYKVETEQCRDEFGIVNKDYIDEVQAWNEDVVKYKAYQRDFWIGIFYPNIYDNFETIDLEQIKYKESEEN